MIIYLQFLILFKEEIKIKMKSKYFTTKHIENKNKKLHKLNKNEIKKYKC